MNIFDTWNYEETIEDETSETLKSLICDLAIRLIRHDETASILAFDIFVNSYIFLHGGAELCK